MILNMQRYTPVIDALDKYATPEIFNTGRPHSRLDQMTPDSVYFNELPQSIAV